MTLDEIVDPILNKVVDDELTEAEAQVELERELKAHGREEVLYYIFVTLRVLVQQKERGIIPDTDHVM